MIQDFLLISIFCIYAYLVSSLRFDFRLSFKRNSNRFYQSHNSINRRHYNSFKICFLSQNPNDIYDEYPSLPSDIFPSNMLDREVIDELMEQRQLDNDRWQSTLFRDTHGGNWNGTFEIGIPFNVNADNDEGLNLRFKKIAIGDIDTTIVASPFTNVGVDISIDETFRVKKISEDYNSFQPIVNMLLQPTRKLCKSNEFRSISGNQNVGNSYTFGNLIVNSENEFVAYIGELAIKDGPVRVRVKYLYSNAIDTDSIILSGFLIIRESLNSIKREDLSYLDLMFTNDVGFSIYDPQERGEEYIEIIQQGKLTLYFPTILKQKLDSKGILTMQWQGRELLFQSDRKFNSLLKASITSLELTEIRPNDATVYQINQENS